MNFPVEIYKSYDNEYSLSFFMEKRCTKYSLVMSHPSLRNPIISIKYLDFQTNKTLSNSEIELVLKKIPELNN